MIGTTSLLTFPIYGRASVIPIVYQRIPRIPTACRGLVYTAGIFFTEFTSGSILKHFSMCPWNYNGAPASVQRTDPSGLCPIMVYRRSSL